VAADGFELAYDRTGAGPAVVLLHGWPGDRTDYRDLAPKLAGCQVVAPDLRGFGESDKHPADPAAQYDAKAQARSVAALITELGLDRPVVAGYDIGSRIAQALASARPELVKALVITPPVPGVGTRVFGADRCASSGTSRFTAWPWPRSSSTAIPTRSARTCGTSGRTGPAPVSSWRRRTSTTWSPSTGRRERSPRQSPGTGPARAPPPGH